MHQIHRTSLPARSSAVVPPAVPPPLSAVAPQLSWQSALPSRRFGTAPPRPPPAHATQSRRLDTPQGQKQYVTLRLHSTRGLQPPNRQRKDQSLTPTLPRILPWQWQQPRAPSAIALPPPQRLRRDQPCIAHPRQDRSSANHGATSSRAASRVHPASATNAAQSNPAEPRQRTLRNIFSAGHVLNLTQPNMRRRLFPSRQRICIQHPPTTHRQRRRRLPQHKSVARQQHHRVANCSRANWSRSLPSLSG